MRAWPELAHRYAIPDVFEIPRTVDLGLLEASLHTVWSRHEALRTSLAPKCGIVRPSYATEALPLDIGHELNLTNLAEELRLDLDDVLAGQPLAQFAIVEHDSRAFLVLRLHHLVVDGWSRSVIWSDIEKAYYAGGNLPPGPAFSCFAQEQHERWARDSVEATAAWAEAFEATYRELPWPLPTVTNTGRRRALATVSTSVLGSSECTYLRAQARAARVSPFTALSFAVGLAMSTWAGAPVLVGSDYANRDDRRWRELVGQVVSTQYIAVDAEAASYSLESALELGADQLRLSRRFRGLCFEQLHGAVGAPPHVKVNNFSATGPEGGAAGVLGLTEVEIERGDLMVRHPWSLMTIAEDDHFLLHQIRRTDLVDAEFTDTFLAMVKRVIC